MTGSADRSVFENATIAHHLRGAGMQGIVGPYSRRKTTKINQLLRIGCIEASILISPGAFFFSFGPGGIVRSASR